MDKTKTFTSLGIVVLCGTFLSTSAYDQALTSRHLIWCLGTIILVAMSKSAKLNWFALGYLGFVLMSGIFAVNISEWVYAMCRAVLLVAYISVVDIDRKLFAKTMICLGVVFAGYFWWDYLTNESVRGLMRMKNFWAAAHFFVIPFCYYAVTKKFWKNIAIVVAVAMVLNIFVISSRSAILALLISVAIIGFSNKKTRIYVCIGGLCVILAMTICSPSAFDTVSFQHRIIQWKPAVRLIQDNIFGVGAGNYWIVFPKYACDIDYPRAFTGKFFRHPHNDYLWIFSEIGVGGFLCYLGMMISALYCAIKKKMTWLVIGIAGYMTIAFFSASHERAFATIMIATMISMAVKGQKIKYIKVIIPVLLCAMVVFGYRYKASCWNKKLRACRGQWQEVIDCSNGNVFATLTHTGLPYLWWSGMANLKTDRPELAAVELAQAYKYNPYNIHAINGNGISKAINGDIEGARHQFEYALEICPDFVDAKANLEKINQ